MLQDTQRYHSLTITLHWVMALAFILMLASGLIMTNIELEQSFKFDLYQWHKSLGVLLLIAFVLRMALKLSFKTPKIPENFSSTERTAAKTGHIALYIWMIALPIAGWIIVSSSIFGLPTFVFNIFEWPHIPYIAANKEIEETAKFIHRILAYSFIALIGLHVAAVVKHAILDNENLLTRMWFTGGQK